MRLVHCEQVRGGLSLQYVVGRVRQIGGLTPRSTTESNTKRGSASMTTEENKACQRRILDEVVNKGNTAVAEELVAKDFVNLNAAPGSEQGRAGFLADLARLRAAFPDMEWTLDEQVAEGDKVACHGVWRGTHQGEFFGIPPTGKRVEVAVTSFDSFVAGQCTGGRLFMDTMSLMQQLGVAPAPGRAS